AGIPRGPSSWWKCFLCFTACDGGDFICRGNGSDAGSESREGDKDGDRCFRGNGIIPVITNDRHLLAWAPRRFHLSRRRSLRPRVSCPQEQAADWPILFRPL